MILVPYPLPDEFDRNIQRRLREMNDFGSDTKMFDVLKNALAPGAKGTSRLLKYFPILSTKQRV